MEKAKKSIIPLMVHWTITHGIHNNSVLFNAPYKNIYNIKAILTQGDSKLPLLLLLLLLVDAAG